MLGRTLGDFRVREKLGAGGAGDVYLADQLALGREAVIKVIAPKEGGSGSTGAAERFMREAKLASTLDHPFAAHIYGFGSENDGLMWIAMELVRGISLNDLIQQQGPVPLARFVPFFERLCEVLQAAHDQGIVHRDIKPHNVMVISRAGRMLPKLLDLGIARRYGDPISEHSATKLSAEHTVDVTMQGAIVGTPHYMPPEQWLDAKKVDARSDLYSLTLLAYHALSGQKPFADLDNVFQLARAHTKKTLPALPDTLPAALNDVIAKGSAKDPNARYQSATELAVALRAASGLGMEQAALPQLDKALHDTLINDAPQPIAEAATLLEGARSLKQGFEAATLLHRVTVRYFATLALAARGRVGPGAPRDSDTVTSLLAKLALSSLEDDEWVALTIEILKPFEHKKAAHPLPELVAFPFELLKTQKREESHEALHAYVKQLNTALQKASFIFDYALIHHGERWMGTRRARRVPHETAEQHPHLIDQVGLPILSLWPLLQAAQPSGGMPDELFFLEGAGRHGARLVALPATFEHQSDEVWRWISEHISDVEQTQQRAAAEEKPPYMGLSTFTSDDADHYYGREKEAEQFANRLRESRFLAVVGPSGVGKSSFVLAGVLPLLPPSVRPVVMRPGAMPLARLLALDIRGETLLVVDQFEELVTLCQDPKERDEFAQALLTAGDHVRVVITLRDDFLIKVQQLEALRDRLSSSLQLLATPAPSDLVRVVTSPAEQVGYTFDEPDLPMRMVEAVQEYPGALALLSFTASQLWELRDRQLRQMRAKTYDALGGVGGALAHHAEVTLAAMTGEEQSLVREAFRHLVTAQGTRAVLSRKESLELLGNSPAAASVLEKLLVARLLVSSESEDGHDRLEIIHEALIVSWPRLARWLREDAETARFRDTLRASARQWDEKGRAGGMLWRKETLAEYKVWRTRYKGRLTAIEDAFALASLRDELRGKRIRQGLAIVAFTALSIALVVIFRAYREATARFLALRQEQGRLALLDDKPLEALAYLAEAAKGGADNEDLRAAAGITEFLLKGSRGVVAHHAGQVWAFALSPDEKRVAAVSDDGDVSITGISGDTTRERVRVGAACYAADFSPDGKRLAVGCEDGKLRLLENNVLSQTLDIERGEVRSLAWRGNTHVVIAQAGRGLRELEVASAKLTPLAVKTNRGEVLRDATGEHVAVFAGYMGDPSMEEAGAAVWDGTTLVRVPVEAMVRNVFFRGDLLTVGAIDGTVGAWSMTKRAFLWKHRAQPQSIRRVELSPDGQQLIATSADYITTWTSDGKPGWTMNPPVAMTSVCYGGDGKLVFATGAEQSLYALDTRAGDTRWRHFGHTGIVRQCVVTRDGTLLSASFDGDVRAWDANVTRDHEVPLDAEIGDIALFPDGRLMLGLANGLYVASPSGSMQTVHAERYGDADSLTVAVDADAAASNHNGVIEVGGRKRKIGWPGPFQIKGDRVAWSNAETAEITLTSLDDEKLQTAKTEDVVQNLAFASDGSLLSCHQSGALRAWSPELRLLSETKEHNGICEVFVVGDQVRSLSSDGHAVTWFWDGNTLRKRGSWDFKEMATAWGSASPFTYMLDVGQWTQLTTENTPLLRLRLYRSGVTRSVANASVYWTIDRMGRLHRFLPPAASTPSSLLALHARRGVFDASTGRLESASKPNQTR